MDGVRNGRAMRRAAVVALGLLALTAGDVASQSISLGARAGTFGLGGEVAVGLTPRLGLRAGFGMVPFTPTGTISDIRYEIEPPSPLASVGVDLSLLRGLRLMGGVLFGAERTEFTGQLTQAVRIGNQTYTPQQVGSLQGTLRTRSAAPFAGLGFGGYGRSPVGVTLDLGVAYLGENDLLLSADGPFAGDPTFQQELERERASVEKDVRRYSRFLPVLNLGFHVAVRR